MTFEHRSIRGFDTKPNNSSTLEESMAPDEINCEGFSPVTFMSLIFAELSRTHKEGIEYLCSHLSMEAKKEILLDIAGHAHRLGLGVTATISSNGKVIRIRKLANQTMTDIFANRPIPSRWADVTRALREGKSLALTEDTTRKLCYDCGINWQVFMKCYRAQQVTNSNLKKV